MLSSSSLSPPEIWRRNPQEDFELLQRVGSGTYGDVYKARNLASNDFAAIKIIKVEPGDDFAIVQQEISMMKECQHRNIVAYYGSYLRRDKLWICMEYCGGGSLQDIYHITGPLIETQIAFICRETLLGLCYLHSHGRMHRDIKGANILLTDDGDVKLADFGVSAQITATLSKRKSFIGSPYWMAPEVAAVERKGGYNQQCDVWAVGITAIEFAELQPPMFDLHPMRALFIMSKSSFRPPQLKDQKRWSLEFHSFIKAALIKHPKRRPTSSKLLEHPFLQGDLDRQIAQELLRKAYGMPEPCLDSQSPDGLSGKAPQRISSVLYKAESDHSAENDRPPKVPPHPIVVKKKDSEYENVQDWSPESDGSKATLPLGNSSWQDGKSEQCLRGTDYNSNCASEAKVGTENDESAHDADGDPASNGEATLVPAGQSVPPAAGDLEPSGGGSHGESFNNAGSPPSGGGLTPETKRNRKPAPNRPVSHGLPPTPEVRMGACFSKIFNGCPLHINCTASWVHPETKDQHLLIAADEGIYTLNLNEIHENSMELLFARRCLWLYIVKDILMSLSGRFPSLYRHDLVLLHNRISNPISLTVDRIPEKLVPRKYIINAKVPDTKGCTKCCVGRNPYNGYKYLCGVTPNRIFLMQWYDPLNKFMLLKHIDVTLGPHLNVFEMFITPELEYPQICVGVFKGNDSNSVEFDLVNLNSSTSWSCDLNSDKSPIDVVHISQLDRETVLLCHDRVIQLFQMNGLAKSIRRHASEIRFNFIIKSLVLLHENQSVLAFHDHGMQGRSIRTNEVTQEISNQDKNNIYRLLGSDRIIVLASCVSGAASMNSNLHVLTGHESTI